MANRVRLQAHQNNIRHGHSELQDTRDESKRDVVYFLAYNLIRLMMAQSALLVNALPRALSFKHALQLYIAWSQQPAFGDDPFDEKILILIAQKTVGNRPERIEPRAVKRRPKQFTLLMKTRDLAREEVRKYGHPKKLK